MIVVMVIGWRQFVHSSIQPNLLFLTLHADICGLNTPQTGVFNMCLNFKNNTVSVGAVIS